MPKIKYWWRYLPLIIAALAQMLWSLFQDTIKEILKSIFGSNLTGLAYAGGVIVIAGLVCGLLWFVARPKPKDIVPVNAKPPKMKGLILLVGKGLQGGSPDDTAARPSIEYHRRDANGTPVLRMCWLVASNDSIKFARELREEYQAQGIVIPEPIEVKPFDPRDAYTAIARIYKTDVPNARLSEDEVIADFTGATKPMSLGMAMACLPFDRPMQYMMGRQPEVATAPMLIQFSTQTVSA